jgi:hypothetical protein
VAVPELPLVRGPEEPHRANAAPSHQ